MNSSLWPDIPGLANRARYYCLAAGRSILATLTLANHHAVSTNARTTYAMRACARMYESAYTATVQLD